MQPKEPLLIKSKPKKLASEQGNHWRTPTPVIVNLQKRGLLAEEFQDPFPWIHDMRWDALDGNEGWGTDNFINPPYNDWKIKKRATEIALKKHDEGANCTLLYPFDFDTAPTQELLVPRLEKLQFGVDWFFWAGRIKFIGYKSSSGQYFNLPEDEKPEGWEDETVMFKGQTLKKNVNGCGLGGSVIYSFIHKKAK